jgi:AraC family transcriptional activator of pobA
LNIIFQQILCIRVAYLSFGQLYKKIYVLKQVWDQENIQKIDDKICPSEFLTSGRQVLKTIWNHIKGSFFYYYSGIGNIKVHRPSICIEIRKKYLLYSWSNPLLSNMSTDLEGKIILFEEVLFCSDILKNELSPYNVNLSPISIAPPFLALNLKRCFLL